MRYLAKVSYDGTNFVGWQIQKTGRTVQAEIEQAFSQIAKNNIPVVAAGRTDSGVHAFGQYFHFDLQNKMTTDQIRLALQTKLDFDIKIISIWKVTDEFHARFKAQKRSYKYFIAKERTPFNRFYKSYFPGISLDFDKIQKCLSYFIGEHDFTSFSKFNPEIKSTICEIQDFNLIETDEDYVFIISANRFLHNMVRRLIGTIINVSRTDVDPEIIIELIEAKTTENKLITTAPAEGLYLFDVEYPKKYFL